jgi:hypothetical protein
VGSFGRFIGHIARHQCILPTSLGSFNFLFVVLIVAPAFMGCWALIVLALVICFQQDDQPILLDVVAHVETNISLF